MCLLLQQPSIDLFTDNPDKKQKRLDRDMLRNERPQGHIFHMTPSVIVKNP